MGDAVEPAKSAIFLDIRSRVSTARNEVGLVVKGGNYGWNTLGGGHCFSPRAERPIWHLPPVIEYRANKSCSVIGGHVYRGTEIPRLNGACIYWDYHSGKVHGFRIEIGEAAGHSRPIDSGLNITSFGEEAKVKSMPSPDAAAFTG